MYLSIRVTYRSPRFISFSPPASNFSFKYLATLQKISSFASVFEYTYSIKFREMKSEEKHEQRNEIINEQIMVVLCGSV